MAVSPLALSTSPFSQLSREDDGGSSPQRNSTASPVGSAGSIGPMGDVMAQVGMCVWCVMVK